MLIMYDLFSVAMFPVLFVYEFTLLPRYNKYSLPVKVDVASLGMV